MLPNETKKIYNFLCQQQITPKQAMSVDRKNIISLATACNTRWEPNNVEEALKHIEIFGVNICSVPIKRIFSLMKIDKGEALRKRPKNKEEYLLGALIDSFFGKEKIGSLSQLFLSEKPSTSEGWGEIVDEHSGKKISAEAERATNYVGEFIKWLIGDITPSQLSNVKDRILGISHNLAKQQSFQGFVLQFGIIKYLSKKIQLPYSFSDDKKDSQSIDGEIGGVDVSIKPHTYGSSSCRQYNKKPTIYYKIDGENIEIDYDELVVTLKTEGVQK